MPKEVRSGPMSVEGFCVCMSGLSPLRIAKPIYSAESLILLEPVEINPVMPPSPIGVSGFQ